MMSFGRLVPLPRDTPLAYDVYFLYDGKTFWEKDPPQLSNGGTNHRRRKISGWEKSESEIEELLKKSD